MLLETEYSSYPVKRGKVRDIYDLGDRLLLIATDRISAFDWVLPTGIPDKGRVLTQLSRFWFEKLDVPNHLLEMDVTKMGLPEEFDLEALAGRTMLVKKTKVVPIECVVRGYLAGSGWKEYRQNRTVCSIPLPEGLKESEKLPKPLFTPSTKAEEGHDENISFEQMKEIVPAETADTLSEKSLEVYQQGADFARQKGIIIADTKFEWGWAGDQLILIDEVLTCDSSRFWPADAYEPGKGQPSFDKQFVRDYLLQTDWDRSSTPPELPEEIVQKTREKYIEAYEILTDDPFVWK
ncbi:Phosphoribosylaminoimidazole-succinocarboxamide synthase [Planctomycetales bacterium 10988]|nr:Phosphoribosylaminoimidazole-succinocarboxamide synthase [Planctomycetales bacterium 10988]